MIQRKVQILLMIGIVACGMWLSACKDFLAASPNQDLNELDNVEDLQRLLDQSIQNADFPNASMLSGENYYVRNADWTNSTNTYEKTAYIWDGPKMDDDWYYMYRRILDQNIVLESLSKLNIDNSNPDFKRVKGTALFLRAYNIYHLAQVMAPQYSSATLNKPAYISLRTSSKVVEHRDSATVKQIYEFILNDCLVAKNLLPDVMLYSTRPSRAAVWALLARIYLQMGEYALAGQAADSSLSYKPILLDYNTVDSAVAAPFPPKTNTEVLFFSLVRAASFFSASTARVDSVLYKSYSNNDLRRALYFQRNTDGTFRFRGNYNGTISAFLFNGLAVDEVYLIAAESQARRGETAAAMMYLNKLAEKRYKKANFSEFTASTADEALLLILSERRKEMLYRGVRWSDLKRLNLDERFRDTIVRVVNGVEYKLLPNSPQYVLGLTN